MSIISRKIATEKIALDIRRVHIAPVGFEIDRIALPAKQMKADVVWLILHSNPHADEGVQFAEKIEEQLRDSGIECKKESADRTDLFDTLRAFREIIEAESQNAIFVNVSVGSKIQAIAAMMACMMFNDNSRIRPYYVVPEKYTTIPKKQETEGVREVKPMPQYRINIPGKNLVKCLQIIDNSRNDKITKKDLRDEALKQSLITVEKKKNEDQSAYMALNNNLLKPLEFKWGFITTEKVRNRYIVSLTEEGRHTLTFLKADEPTTDE